MKTNKDTKKLTLQKLINDERGANLVEYIILVGVVALIALVGFKVFGTNVQTKVNEQATAVTGINGS